MQRLEKYRNGTFLLKVPFENIDTAVWLFKAEKDLLLIDCTCGTRDVQEYILPAIKDIKTDNSTGVTLLISHAHEDHAGGAAALFDAFPCLRIYAAEPSLVPDVSGAVPMQEGDVFGGFLEVWRLRGHSVDACAFFDRRSKTLYTGDCIQFYGVGRYGCGICDSVSAYITSLARIASADVEAIMASHDYFPEGREVCGKENVHRYIKTALCCLRTLLSGVCENENSSAEEIAAGITQKLRKEFPECPPVPPFTVRKMCEEGPLKLLQLCNNAIASCVGGEK